MDVAPGGGLDSAKHAIPPAMSIPIFNSVAFIGFLLLYLWAKSALWASAERQA